MKYLVYLLFLVAITSCGNGNGSTSADSSTVAADSSFSGTMMTDTTGARGMNADTTGMGNAR